MAQVGVTEAARLTGKGWPTIYRAIEAGTLSATRDARGRATVDVAELERVYGPLERPEALAAVAVLEERLRQLEERVQDQRRELDAVRDEKGRLLALLETRAHALADLRERDRQPAPGGHLESVGCAEVPPPPSGTAPPARPARPSPRPSP